MSLREMAPNRGKIQTLFHQGSFRAAINEPNDTAHPDTCRFSDGFSRVTLAGYWLKDGALVQGEFNKFSLSWVTWRKTVHISSVDFSPHRTSLGGLLGLLGLLDELS